MLIHHQNQTITMTHVPKQMQETVQTQEHYHVMAHVLQVSQLAI